MTSFETAESLSGVSAPQGWSGKTMRAPYWMACGLMVLCMMYSWAQRREPPDPRLLPASAIDPTQTYSNILPGDYTGPAACQECHPREFARWSKHPHRFMNQLPSKQSVKGDFSGLGWERPDGTSASFTTEGSSYLMTVEQPGKARKRFEVTRTVGSRFMQFYIGVQREGPESKDDPAYSTEHKLPWAYWFRMQRWLPVAYFDGSAPEPLADGVPMVEGIDRPLPFFAYTQHCMHCHNTYPYAYRIFRPELVGFPDATIAAVPGPLSAALSATTPVEPNLRSLSTALERLHPDRDLVTLGISCESCHLGGHRHARKEEPIRFAPTSPFVQARTTHADRPLTGSRKEPAASLGTCAQCHAAPVREYPNGAGVANSREATDLHRGACASRIRCVDCHEPHTATPATGEALLAKSLQACVRCHSELREPEQQAAHARHPSSAGVSCLDCHMPRYTQGLNDVVHTHRIAVPAEKSMVAGGLSNACNLCHLDRSVSWTLKEIERGWGKRIEPGEDWASAGVLDRPAGPTWLQGTDAMTRLVTTEAYARSPLGQANLPRVLLSLTDPVPVNRAFALFSAERLLGRKLSPREIDITAPPASRLQQVDALLSRPAGK